MAEEAGEEPVETQIKEEEIAEVQDVTVEPAPDNTVVVSAEADNHDETKPENADNAAPPEETAAVPEHTEQAVGKLEPHEETAAVPDHTEVAVDELGEPKIEHKEGGAVDEVHIAEPDHPHEADVSEEQTSPQKPTGEAEETAGEQPASQKPAGEAEEIGGEQTAPQEPTGGAEKTAGEQTASKEPAGEVEETAGEQIAPQEPTGEADDKIGADKHPAEGDNLHLETEQGTVEKVGETRESTTKPEGDVAGAEPTHLETDHEAVDGAYDEQKTEVPVQEGADEQPQLDTEPSDVVKEGDELVTLETDVQLPRERTEWEKLEIKMAKEAEAEAIAAGVSAQVPEVVCSVKTPEILNAESFFKSLKALQTYLQPSETKPSTYVAARKIQQMVTQMRSEMNCLREFCEATQAEMSKVREPIKVITDEIFNAIPKPTMAQEIEQTPSALDAELRQKTAHSQLAQINEALLIGMKLVAQTESAVADAQMAVIEAIELAKRVQDEAEQKLKNELEAKRLAFEAEKAEIAQKKQEEEMRIAQALIDAEMLKKRAENVGKEVKPVTLPIDTMYEFDGGIGCIFYSELLTQKMLKCHSVDLCEASFEYLDNEELISHIISILPVNKLTTIRTELKISIPHGLTRQQATFREVVVKMQTAKDEPWKELLTHDVTIEGFRDMKFAEVSDIKTFCTFAVVSRLKKDIIKMKKRGGTSVSKVDERVEFIYDPGSFNVREKVILQMQPVDNATITELKRSLDVAKGLLCSTAVFRTTWRNTNFESPITVTMILPPNPVAARKLAAERSAKDGKRTKSLTLLGEDGENLEFGKKKGTGKSAASEPGEASLEGLSQVTSEHPDPLNELLELEPPTQEGEAPEVGEKVAEDGIVDQETADEKAFADSHKMKKSKKDEESEERKALWCKPVKWYMGKYGKDVEDERDQLFFVRYNSKKGRWMIEPNHIDVGKFDKIFVELEEPLEAFVVFRVSMSVMERDVERIADALEILLARRVVRFVVKQQFSDPCEVLACIVPIQRMERVLRRLQEEDYENGPETSAEFLIKEGDRLSLVFRGNIVCEDNTAILTTVFTSNLDTRFKLRISANDVYVQKSYDEYRGFAQLRLIYEVLIEPEEPKMKDAKAAAAEKTAALMAAKKAAEDEEQRAEEEEASKKAAADAAADAMVSAAVTSETAPTSATAAAVADETASTSEAATSVKRASVEEAKVDGSKAATADATAVALEVEEPPVSLYETHEELLTESLITFPKDSIALKTNVPKKAPITYIPLKDVISHDILKKLAENPTFHETEWLVMLDELHIKANIQSVVRRRGEMKKQKQGDMRYEMLLQWVKTLEKGADKWELLSNALLASLNTEVATSLARTIALAARTPSEVELDETEAAEEELNVEEARKQAQLQDMQENDENLKNQEGDEPLRLQLKPKKAAFT